MTSNEIRQKYLDFCKSKGHVIVPSASLLPENDPTTLFTGSGMQPMVPYLLGESHPGGVRIADSQKCFRSQDIEEVGDNRHTTFFEMLGNWSLGDYFKDEQISWVFEFLIKELGLDPNKLFVTVFRGSEEFGIERDEESVKLWQGLFSSVGINATAVDFSERDGMQDGRIFYYDETKNWWSRVGLPKTMPAGEIGGPDSEIFWDFGSELGLHEVSEWKEYPCHVNCDCGRFLEIGNNVFMQYQKTTEGFEELPKRNVDFGGGFERIAAVAKGSADIFQIDLFDKARKRLAELSGKEYGVDIETTKAMRIILDHLRAAVFLISDGAVPSNKDQGYFTRRLIRRAVRFAHSIGIEKITREIGESFISEYSDSYPDLIDKKEFILNQLDAEEEKFGKSLVKGLKEFEKRFVAAGSISGDDAFILYSTYGFPLELTEELAMDKGQKVDQKAFQVEFKKHQDLSRSSSKEKFTGGLADHSNETVQLHTATHLLHQALRTVLGDHVEQKGSNITSKRLRFDFSHPQKMTQEEKEKVTDLVNQAISNGYKVNFEELSFDEAKERGAIGLFEDKYASLGNKVKVYFVGPLDEGRSFSVEVCGGPHVKNTGELGVFSIKKEESASSGVRRIKAVLKVKE